MRRRRPEVSGRRTASLRPSVRPSRDIATHTATVNHRSAATGSHLSQINVAIKYCKAAASVGRSVGKATD